MCTSFTRHVIVILPSYTRHVIFLCGTPGFCVRHVPVMCPSCNASEECLRLTNVKFENSYLKTIHSRISIDPPLKFTIFVFLRNIVGVFEYYVSKIRINFKSKIIWF